MIKMFDAAQQQFLSPLGPKSNDTAQAEQAFSGSDKSSASAAGAAAFSPVAAPNFPALDDNGQFIPPDTQGAVGPNHLMVALNSQIRIQTRAGATISTMSTFGFWALLGVQDVSDPHVVYDPFNDRWIFTMIANFPPFAFFSTPSVVVRVSQ